MTDFPIVTHNHDLDNIYQDQDAANSSKCTIIYLSISHFIFVTEIPKLFEKI